ncbi:MFS transporter [Microbispora sp. ATCC PTA-5024]|uniref:MFS transporter n=1 Tax=Microbispora sp. ATCC PTA-5024 TaxID=316330 RepID=UPI0003DCA759|nr:MFS transporter [Microbispora sp. ATCC PTA-5024]ETK30538.1 membrane protein [Microbispora sp. ATCC PTA-5024]
MSITATPQTHKRAGPALAALFLGTFVMGMAELLVVGVLDLIARDFEVSLSSTGTLVTSYAFGLAVGGPVLTALTIRLSRRRLLSFSMAAYVLGNVVMAFAGHFAVLLAARAVTGAVQGLFIGVAFAVGASVVTPDRMGRAISIVIGGVAVSIALGVPIGTLIGQGLGWRGAFLAVVGLGLVALVALVALVPTVTGTGVEGLRAQARFALAPRVLAMLVVGFLLLGGQYAALTYITPFLQQVTGVSGAWISAFLLAYGAATAVGAFAGGWAADRNAARTLGLANLVLVGALGALWLNGTVPVLVALALLVWGLVGFGLVPSLQYRVVDLAGPGRDLAATLPASAVNTGIAVGALAGGWSLDSFGPASVVVTGLLVCLVALPATWASGLLKVRPQSS